MPANETSLQITEKYRRGMIDIRGRAKAEARRAWRKIDPDRIDDTYPVGLLALMVSSLQRQAAQLSAGYLRAFIQSELERPVGIPLVDARQVGSARNGDQLRDALRSPVIGAKAGIGDGKEPRQALAEGGRALERLVGLATDTAARDALAEAIRAHPGIAGWQRAVKGTCGACAAAATGTESGDLRFEVHPDCQCVQEPVVKSERLESLKRDQRIEVHNPQELVDGKWVPVEGPVRGKVAKFDADSVMVNAGTAKKPRWVTASRFDAYKPAKAAATKVDELAKGDLDFMRRLTKAEKSAVDSYKGYGYKQINGQLRAGKAGGAAVRNLDSALQKGSLGSDRTLYRSFHLPRDRGVGDIFQDQAFVSTSTKREVAGRFEATGGKRALVRIHAKAGQRGGFFPGQNEAEFLLPRNTRFRITGESMQGGVRVVDMEIL